MTTLLFIHDTQICVSRTTSGILPIILNDEFLNFLLCRHSSESWNPVVFTIHSCQALPAAGRRNDNIRLSAARQTNKHHNNTNGRRAQGKSASASRGVYKASMATIKAATVSRPAQRVRPIPLPYCRTQRTMPINKTSQPESRTAQSIVLLTVRIHGKSCLRCLAIDSATSKKPA